MKLRFVAVVKAHKVLISAIAIGLGLGATALAAAKFHIHEKEFNPDKLDLTITAVKVKGAGNPAPPAFPDFKDDKENHGWVLARNNTVATGSGASADLTVHVDGDKPILVSEVGFDRLMGGTQCGGGSPRFNVETAAGVLFLECNTPPGVAAESGFQVTTTRTNLGNGWERIRFVIAPAATATFLQVLSDSGPGAALLDNINVDGTLVGK